MRILFLCGSLEPGRDGVGDYTRRLAGEIIRQGHETMIIALHDRYVNETNTNNYDDTVETSISSKVLNTLQSMWGSDLRVRCCTHYADGTPVHVIRIALSLPWVLRGRIVENAARLFAADWVSLQFVPYAFHHKGLPFQLVWMLRVLKQKIPSNWHIMFHEFRVGMIKGSRIRDRVIGLGQLIIIKAILRTIQPLSLYTSNDFYLALLLQHEIRCDLVPLFGNFSLESNENYILSDELARFCILPNTWEDPIRLICFASIHSVFPFESFLKDAYRLHLRIQRPIVLISIGQQGAGESLWKKWQACAEGTSFMRLCALGPMEPKNIRAVFSQADAGVSLSSQEVCGKSGAVAAMLESGLMVYGYLGNLTPKGIDWSFKKSRFVSLINNWENYFDDNYQKKQASYLVLVAEKYINSFINT